MSSLSLGSVHWSDLTLSGDQLQEAGKELKVMEIVLIADPRVLAIPIQECGEELVDLRTAGKIKFGPSPEVPDNQDYTKMRKTVYEKLLEAQSYLPSGLKIGLYEGLRSWELQKQLFDTRSLFYRKLHADWDAEKIHTETTKLVSPVINLDGSENHPPHCSGAAVDVYLIDEKTGKMVDMGFDLTKWLEDTDPEIAMTKSTKISDMEKANRAILCDVMERAGFTNYPTEFWHWSYGDRYDAYHKGEQAARYGAVKKSGNL